MTFREQRLSGWGGVPTESCRVAQIADRVDAVRFVAEGPPGVRTIGRGLGRAYGDSAIVDGIVADCTGLDRFIAFDPATGLCDCESGVSLAEIISVFLPRGWFLPTTPGTKFVTVGGAIAADVHGKNHGQKQQEVLGPLVRAARLQCGRPARLHLPHDGDRLAHAMKSLQQAGRRIHDDDLIGGPPYAKVGQAVTGV